MVKHIILWKLKETLSPEEKESVKKDIKEHLESLSGKIPGLMEITVRCLPPMQTSCWIVHWKAGRR